MPAYNKFEDFVEQLCRGTHDFRAAGHQFNVYLSNATPSASLDAAKADLAEITAENGYTAQGADAQQDMSETGGTATITATDITWTASGGTIGPFRYAVFFNETVASPLVDPLVSYWDYGSELTLQDGESFTVDFGASVFTLT